MILHIKGLWPWAGWAAKAQPVRGQAVALVAGSEGGTDDGWNCCDKNIMIFNIIQHGW